AAYRHDMGELGECVAVARDHRGVIEVAEGGGNEDRLRAGVPQDVGNFRIPVDRDDRVADQPEHRASEVDHDGFRPVGQIEAYHVARREAAALERARERAGLVVELCRGQGAPALDDQYAVRV